MKKRSTASKRKAKVPALLPQSKIRSARDLQVYETLKRMARNGRIETEPSHAEIADKVREFGFATVSPRDVSESIGRLRLGGRARWVLEVAV